MVTHRHCVHPCCTRKVERATMRTEREVEMRTALRQAGSIAAIGGQQSTRQILGLAHALYNAMILLEPGDRARRTRLIDAIFGRPARGREQRPAA